MRENNYIPIRTWLTMMVCFFVLCAFLFLYLFCFLFFHFFLFFVFVVLFVFFFSILHQHQTISVYHKEILPTQFHERRLVLSESGSSICDRNYGDNRGDRHDNDHNDDRSTSSSVHSSNNYNEFLSKLLFPQVANEDLCVTVILNHRHSKCYNGLAFELA